MASLQPTNLLHTKWARTPQNYTVSVCYCFSIDNSFNGHHSHIPFFFCFCATFCVHRSQLWFALVHFRKSHQHEHEMIGSKLKLCNKKLFQLNLISLFYQFRFERIHHGKFSWMHFHFPFISINSDIFYPALTKRYSFPYIYIFYQHLMLHRAKTIIELDKIPWAEVNIISYRLHYNWITTQHWNRYKYASVWLFCCKQLSHTLNTNAERERKRDNSVKLI